MNEEMRNRQTEGPKTVATGGGVGLGTVTFAVLLVLKILGHLPMMSWFAVLTSWIWIPLLILTAFLVMWFIAFGFVVLIQWVAEGSHKK